MKNRLLVFGFAALLASRVLAQPAGPLPGPRPGDPDRLMFVVQMLQAIGEKTGLLLEQGKIDLAIEELKRVQSIDVPKDHPVYEGKARLIGRLATIYANTGRKKEAVDTIRALLAEVTPGSGAEAVAAFDAGMVYRKCDMPDEALQAFDRAIELSQKLAQSAPRQGPRPGGRRPPGGGPAPAPEFRQ